MNNRQILERFEQINRDCQKTGETVVPLDGSDACADYYSYMMENLEFSQEQIESFLQYLRDKARG